MTVYKWSQNPDTNASSDASINWVEGQAPSTVNNSARAVMAAIAKMRDDISGKLVTSTGGTSTAYSVSSNQGFDSLPHMDGAMLSLKFDKINGTPVTLNVDGLGAKPLRVSPGVELPVNNLVIGVPYGITYSNADGVWYFQDGALTAATVLAPILVPIGGVIIWMSTILPSASWWWCNGQQVTSPALATGGKYPSQLIVNSTTIVTPDFRELVPYGLAGMGGTGARASVTRTDLLPNAGNWSTIGAGTNSFVGESAHTLTSGESRAHTHAGNLDSTAGAGTAPDHLHNVPQVVAIGGGLTLGLAQGNNVGPTTTGNADRVLNLGIALNSGHFTTVGAVGDDSVGFGDGAHNTTQPSYPVPFIIRIA